MNSVVPAIGYTNSQNINLDNLLQPRTNLNAVMNQKNETAKYSSQWLDDVGSV